MAARKRKRRHRADHGRTEGRAHAPSSPPLPSPRLPSAPSASDDENLAAFLRELDELVRLGIFEPGPKPGMFRVAVDADRLAAALYAQIVKRGAGGPDPES